MREIKFRAWDKGDNRMIDHLAAFVVQDDNSVDVYAMDGANYPQGSNIECSFHSFQPGQLVVMQYTGLKDKNGVEIYEGDIVSDRGELCEVVWYKAGWWLKQYGELFPYSYMENIEVIGNIYEHPDLMEKL